MKEKKPVIFVVGCTASGKSAWGMRLAQRFNGVIVNCDSIQVYKKLDIGSAKATPQERALVPHYLIDYVDPPREMTAGVYSEDFAALMKSFPEGRPVFVVGGTGFYFRALEKGMYPVTRISEELKRQVEAEMQAVGGPQKLYQELQSKDPEYAARIHRADHYRIGRGVELLRTQGRSITEIQKEFAQSQPDFPYPLLKLGPSWSRDDLRERITQRSAKMLQQGLVEEVSALLDEGLRNWAPLRSVGYRETIQALDEGWNDKKLLEMISINTAQLAKKQRTWFGAYKDIEWCDGKTEYLKAQLLVEKFLKP